MHPLLLKSRFSIAFCYIEFRLTLQRSSHRYRLYSLKGLFSARFGYIGFRPSGSSSCGPRGRNQPGDETIDRSLLAAPRKSAAALDGPYETGIILQEAGPVGLAQKEGGRYRTRIRVSHVQTMVVGNPGDDSGAARRRDWLNRLDWTQHEPPRTGNHPGGLLVR